jgi:hypothetical protein
VSYYNSSRHWTFASNVRHVQYCTDVRVTAVHSHTTPRRSTLPSDALKRPAVASPLDRPWSGPFVPMKLETGEASEPSEPSVLWKRCAWHGIINRYHRHLDK